MSLRAARQLLLDVLTARQLKVVPYGRTVDRPTLGVVVFDTRDVLFPTSMCPQLGYRFDLYLLPPHDDVELAEDAIDALIGRVVDALDDCPDDQLHTETARFDQLAPWGRCGVVTLAARPNDTP